jgi:uncharacterized protein YcbK (DUF882 family)
MKYKAQDLKCPCCPDIPMVYGKSLAMIASMANKISEHLGIDIKITSALRCVRHNKDVKGKPNSEHLVGTAIDVFLPLEANVTLPTLRLLITVWAFNAGFKTIIVYPRDTYIHLSLGHRDQVGLFLGV